MPDSKTGTRQVTRMSDRTVALSPLATAILNKDRKAVLRALQTANLEGPILNRDSRETKETA